MLAFLSCFFIFCQFFDIVGDVTGFSLDNLGTTEKNKG